MLKLYPRFALGLMLELGESNPFGDLELFGALECECTNANHETVLVEELKEKVSGLIRFLVQ